MKLDKAQNITTSVFIILMIINILAGLSLFESTDVFFVYIKIYGVHLAIILTYYFVQDPVKAKTVPPFKLMLLITLILLWNGLIMFVTVYSEFDINVLQQKLGEFPNYANILIASGIVWLFNGNKKNKSSE